MTFDTETYRLPINLYTFQPAVRFYYSTLGSRVPYRYLHLYHQNAQIANQDKNRRDFSQEKGIGVHITSNPPIQWTPSNIYIYTFISTLDEMAYYHFISGRLFRHYQKITSVERKGVFKFQTPLLFKWQSCDRGECFCSWSSACCYLRIS